MDLRKLAALATAALMLTAATACGASNNGDNGADKSGGNGGEYVLKIGEAQGALCHAPLQIAMENGYLDEAGIKWERVDFGKGDIQAALGAGTIDCGFGLVGKFVQPIDNGLNMVVTAGMHTGCTKLLVKSDSGIKTLDDLKGKKIGVSSLAGSECVTAKRALHEAGFDISAESKDVEFLVFGVTDQPQALQNGAVDAICTPDPVATQAEKEFGLDALLDTAVTEPYASEYCCVTFVTKELAEQHPDVAAKFTDACLKASAWVAEHPDETAKLQVEKEYVSGDPAANAEILKSYQFIPSVKGGQEALVNVSRDLKTIGMLQESTDPDELATRSFKIFEGVPDSYKTEDGKLVAVE